jgi:paraquat-inducible protein A
MTKTEPCRLSFLECPLCGASVLDRELQRGEELRCVQCHQTVKRLHHGDPSHHLWALSTTGLILCVLANVYPILTFDVAGNTQSNLIITGVFGLINQGYWPIATLVFFCAIAAPVMQMAALWYVAGACCTGRRWPAVEIAARAAERLGPWSLVPVFVIACFVAVVKLDMLGSVYWDMGIVWVSLLGLCSLVIAQIADREFIAARIRSLV